MVSETSNPATHKKGGGTTGAKEAAEAKKRMQEEKDNIEKGVAFDSEIEEGRAGQICVCVSFKFHMFPA